jgi:hypothetical protein
MRSGIVNTSRNSNIQSPSMPIQVDCQQCGKEYRVADTAAGKKFRCKSCEGIVKVPAAESPQVPKDPWDDLDLDAYESPVGGAPPTTAPLPRRRSSKPGRRKASRSGMPIPVIGAIVCESVLILLNVVGVGGNLMEQNIGGACGSIFRILIEAAAIAGFVKAQKAAQITALVLCVLGIVFGLTCSGVLMFAAGNLPAEFQQQFPQDMMLILVAVIGFQILVWIVETILLLVPSSREYFIN